MVAPTVAGVDALVTDGGIGDAPFVQPISPHMMAARTSSVPRRCVGVFNRFALTVSASVGCLSQAPCRIDVEASLSYFSVGRQSGS